MSSSSKLHRTALTAILAVVWLWLAMVHPAQADWRKDIGVFRVGIVSSDDLTRTQIKAEPFRLAVSEALGIEVELFIAKDSASLVSALASSRIEYAVLSSIAYALTWALCECVEPLVLPQSADNSDSYHTVLISSPDGPASLEELKNQPVGALAEDSFIGYPLTVYLLRQQGIDLLGDDIGIEFETGAQAAVQALVSGKFVSLIGWSSLQGDPASGYSRGTLSRIGNMPDGDPEGYQVIWQSPPIPHHPHTIRKSLDGEIKRLLRDLLMPMFESDPVAYDSIEPVFSGGFIAARHASFSMLVEFVRSGVIGEIENKKLR